VLGDGDPDDEEQAARLAATMSAASAERTLTLGLPIDWAIGLTKIMQTA